MSEKKTVCLLNDSFPPFIDGVANTVINYAQELPAVGYEPMVITPSHPEADDSRYPYTITRYPSFPAVKFEGYPASIPFSPEVAGKVKEKDVALLHSHCPVMSTYMARQLRQIADVPIIFTYHTKFDVDIANVIKGASLQNACKKVLVSNISACDEVWVVSQGAGENLQSIGYEGDYVVMPNGVDMPLGKAPQIDIDRATQNYDLPDDIPVYLFVGRMMWYKGLRIIVDALSQLKARGKQFCMVFVGGGEEAQEVQNYAASCGIGDRCVFTGAIHDRTLLRGWYSRADLLLFPSTYDTNGLVVREAAASSVAAVLIKGSCAAEGISDGRNGFLIEETADALAALLRRLTRQQMHQAGTYAAGEIYLSWETAVKTAAERYAVVIDKYKSGDYPRKITPTEGVMKLNGEMMDIMRALRSVTRSHRDSIR